MRSCIPVIVRGNAVLALFVSVGGDVHVTVVDVLDVHTDTLG